MKDTKKLEWKWHTAEKSNWKATHSVKTNWRRHMQKQLTWRRLTPEIQLESDGLYENNSK